MKSFKDLKPGDIIYKHGGYFNRIEKRIVTSIEIFENHIQVYVKELEEYKEDAIYILPPYKTVYRESFTVSTDNSLEYTNGIYATDSMFISSLIYNHYTKEIEYILERLKEYSNEIESLETEYKNILEKIESYDKLSIPSKPSS